MWLEDIQGHLLIGDAESDPGFRDQIQRLSHIGLKVVGGTEAAVSAFMTVAYLLLDPNPYLVPLRLLLGAVMVTVGMTTFGLASVRSLYRFSRLMASISGIISTLVLIWFFVHMTRFERNIDDFIPGNMTLVMLIAVAAIPFRPVQTLFFGGLMLASYVLVAFGSRELDGVGPGVEVIYVVFMFMLTLLACALSTLLYDQRRSSWAMHVRMLQSAENLRQAETRSLLAQNAASVGRLAAALSHELNSPIGALISGVDTLLLLAARQATSGGQDAQRLVLLQNDLRKSIRQSTDRLKEIVARMQRFTNLDKAEVQAANVNEILTDVMALLEPTQAGRAKIDLDLQPVPELVCRPQQLSAVFSNLLGNAVEATNGDGRVRVATRKFDSQVEIQIEDNGRGLEQSQLDNIFDPGFRVTGGRVSTGNWSMFSSRQIIREHGGEIRINSRPGKGTCVSVTLPVEGQVLT